jgi:hypothetical protein
MEIAVDVSFLTFLVGTLMMLISFVQASPFSRYPLSAIDIVSQMLNDGRGVSRLAGGVRRGCSWRRAAA